MRRKKFSNELYWQKRVKQRDCRMMVEKLRNLSDSLETCRTNDLPICLPLRKCEVELLYTVIRGKATCPRHDPSQHLLLNEYNHHHLPRNSSIEIEHLFFPPCKIADKSIFTFFNQSNSKNKKQKKEKNYWQIFPRTKVRNKFIFFPINLLHSENNPHFSQEGKKSKIIKNLGHTIA